MSRSQIHSPRELSGVRHATTSSRRLVVGAEIVPGKGVSFRVWAPKRSSVDVVLWRDLPDGDWQSAEPAFCQSLTVEAENEGYFSALVSDAAARMCYGFRLDGGRVFPDPASRFQPRGPIGPSQIIDAREFGWSDSKWSGIAVEGQVLYEMHIGTISPAGTWSTAQERLSE